jgi:hypothetical protein
MSCEYRRRKFLTLLVRSASGGGSVAIGDVAAQAGQVAALERIYQQAYDAARARLDDEQRRGVEPATGQTSQDGENRRKTYLLFGHMLRMGVPLPVHSSSGLPKPEAQAGYAALWDVLKTRITVENGLPSSATRLAKAAEGSPDSSVVTPGWTGPWLGGDGSGVDSPNYDQEGYSRDGYDRQGFDRRGCDRFGYDRAGYNRDGYDRFGYDANGRDRQGYDKEGYDRDGYNRRGFDKEGRDRWGYDWMGFDRAGFDRTGYNKYGYNRSGFDKDGYDREGYDKRGYNRRGYNRQGLNSRGVDRFGYDAQGLKDGFDKQGYDSAGFDSEGYDRDGYDKDGYDRAGYNRQGKDRSGGSHPWWVADAGGYYGDGLDRYGFDREGYDADGRDRWGFNRQGLNERDRDRDGYNREGYDSSFLDRERYNQVGYDAQGYDRLGYNMHGLTAAGTDRSGYSITGYDKDGYDHNGIDRWGRDRQNRDARTGRQYKNPPWNKSGFDKDGYDRWGFHRDTGLTADGRNYAGWVYNPRTKRCHDPADPTNHSRTMPHSHYQDGRGVQWQRPRWQTRIEWDPSVAPRWDPRAPMTWEEYARVNSTHESVRRSYEARLNPQPNVEQRWHVARAQFDPLAASGGLPARCPQCGQFTGYTVHQCPAFGNRAVTVYRSGLARREGWTDYLRAGDDYSDKGVHADTRQTMDGCYPTLNAYGPFANGHSDANPRRAAGLGGVEERDPAYSNGGYNRYGYDQEDLDRSGRDRRGRDEEGYDRAGYDWLGRDRDGYDRHGHDRSGYNRAGVKRPRSLEDLAGDYSTPGIEGDILANEGVRRLYSQVATSLAGKPRQVVFREGEGFATDMQGTIYLDPYPLGRDAPPVYNAAVVMEGLQHEMGHELETPLDTFKRILEIGSSPEPVEGLDGGRSLVKGIYNIVEDGRMERRISSLPGVAEYLAVGCKLQPRWDERVGEGVPLSHEVQGALLYEALPYYQVRPEVLDAMTPTGRAIFEELRSIVHRGVFGDPEDAYRASIDIARRLQEEGITAPDEQLRVPVPAFFFFAGAAEGDGGDSQGAGGGGMTISVPAGASGGSSQSSQAGSDGPGRNGGSGSPGTQGVSGVIALPTSETAGASSTAGTGAGTGAGAGAGDGAGTDDRSVGTPMGADASGGAIKQPTSDEQGQQAAAQGGTAGDQRGSAPRQQSTQGHQGRQGASAPGSHGHGQPQRQSQSASDAPAGATASPELGNDGRQAKPGGQGGETGQAGLRDVNAPFSEAQARRVLDELERDLSAAVESDIRRQSRVEVLGRNLHKPIGARQDAEQVYRDSQGRVRSASVQFPSLPAGDAAQTKVQKRRATHRQVARQLARYLENVQDVAEETVNFQTRGKLDRHRYAAAMKDAPDVYRRRVEVEGAGFALSMAVDVSGSMSKEMRSGALCDAAMVLSDACEDLQMPYEVRSFSSRTYQYKAMDDPTFSLDRAAMLLSGEGGGTNMAQTAGLAATSLLARPERNKLFVSLTDGDLGDHDSTMRQMEQARRDGVLTFGIFLSRGGYVNRERMDQIYGKANWTTINSIGEMPRAVGQRIALLMRRAR